MPADPSAESGTRAAPGAWRRYVQMLRPQTGRVLLAAMFMAGLAAATALYAYLCGPLLKMLFIGGTEAPGAGPLPVPDEAPFQLDPSTWSRELVLWALPLLLVAAAALKGLCDLAQRSIMGRVSLALIADLRRDVFGRLLERSPAATADERHGDLLARLITDVARAEEAARAFAEGALRDALQVIGLLVLILWLDFRLALVALAILPLSAATVGALGRAVRRASASAQNALGDLSAAAGESLRNLRAVKALGIESHEVRRVDAASSEYTRQAARAVTLRAAHPAVTELLGGVGLAAVIGWASARIAAGTLTPEAFVSLFAAALLLYQPTKALSRLHGTMQAGAAALARVTALTDVPGEPPDRARVTPPPQCQGTLAWDNVVLRRGDRTVLQGATLEVRPGEVVALVGATGAGKTSMLDLALRFVEPDSGRITLDGNDVRDLPRRWLRRQIAVVHQEPLLFRATIAANVAYGEESPDPQRVQACLRSAGLGALLARLPEGGDTLVGEGGATLSGGERQRVSIARALYRDARVVLLDEATSALDADAEDAVRQQLRTLAKDRAVLLVTHRLSTARVADRIAVLEDGAIQEQGSHAALVESNGLYARLWTLQHGAGTDARS